MNNELATTTGGEDIFSVGSDVISGRATRLPLSGKLAKKGNYVVGKYLGMKTITPKEGDSFTIASVAVLETNMIGDSGPIVAGEVCSVGASGLLAWGLQKVAVGRMVAIRFDGKGLGVSSDGVQREMNRYTVKDVTEHLEGLGIK